MRFAAAFVAVLLVALASSAQTPRAIEASLVTYFENTAKFGSYGGSYDEGKLSKNNDLIEQTLVKNGSRADILRYRFPKLQDKMYIVTSRDGRFRIYSWDLEDGGTMHDFENMFQYVGKSGKTYAVVAEESEKGSGFYTDIFQVAGPDGPIYLGVSTGIGSTSINAQSLSAFTIDGDKFNDKANVINTASGVTNSVGFGYDFFSVVDHPERPVRLFFWNDANKSFRFPIVIEDDKTPNGRVTNKFITYKFNGKYFVKVT